MVVDRCSRTYQDIDPRNADRREDLTALSFSSGPLIRYLLMLEHILDDGSAMALHRGETWWSCNFTGAYLG